MWPPFLVFRRHNVSSGDTMCLPSFPPPARPSVRPSVRSVGLPSARGAPVRPTVRPWRSRPSDRPSVRPSVCPSVRPSVRPRGLGGLKPGNKKTISRIRIFLTEHIFCYFILLLLRLLMFSTEMLAEMQKMSFGFQSSSFR